MQGFIIFALSDIIQPKNIKIMTRNYLFLLLGLSLFLLNSCVTSRRYQEEVTAKNNANANAAAANSARMEAEQKLAETEARVEKLESDYKKLKEDYDLLQERYNQQQRLNKDLQDSYDKLLALNEKLKDDAASQKRELAEELNVKRRELERKERELREAEDRLRRDREALEQMRKDMEGKDKNISSLEDYKRQLEKDLEAREKRIKDLEAAIKERDAKSQALRDRLLEALKVFKDAGDLDVEIRNGKVYVSLSQKLLFASGSAKIDKRGLDALKTLAEVLNRSTELSILIEGHTDSDGDAKMNWDLSSQRALSVTQELIKNKVDPSRVTAAGRGKHAPKASNDNDAGKAINRRTEIILEPQLDEIMSILNK